MVEQIFWLFGFILTDLDEVRKQVEIILRIKFNIHDSSYQRGCYYLWRNFETKEMCKIQENYWKLPGEEEQIAESKYPEYPIIMYIVESCELSVLGREGLQKLEKIAFLLQKSDSSTDLEEDDDKE